MIVYFSATGNSRYCAQYLAERLTDTATDVTQYLRQNESPALVSQLPWVFVCPTYAWQIPRVFADLIRRGSFAGSREAYFVMTCGADTGNAQACLQKLCREKNFAYMGLFPIVMPDNYLVMFQAPGPKEAREILVAARPQLEDTARHIQMKEPAASLPVNLLDRIKSGPVNQGMYRYYIRTKKFFVTDQCISCGKCTQICPLANIQLQNGRPHWNSRCTHCMACINLCPTGAIEYGKSTRGKLRYHCPDDPA